MNKGRITKKIILPNAGLSLNETEGGFLDYYSLENCPELSTFILLIRRIVNKSSPSSVMSFFEFDGPY